MHKNAEKMIEVLPTLAREALPEHLKMFELAIEATEKDIPTARGPLGRKYCTDRIADLTRCVEMLRAEISRRSATGV